MKKTGGSKFFFTLIEIMVVMIIIAIASSAIGIKISRSISDHEYKRSAAQIFEKLKFAKKLALANQCDVYFSLSQEKNKVFSEVGYFEGKEGKNQMKYRHGYSNLRFKFDSQDGNIYDKSLTLIFTSSGDYLPKGFLKLIGTNKSNHSAPEEIDFKEFFVREGINK